MLLDNVSGFEFRAPNQVRRDHEIRGLTGEVWEVLHFCTQSSFSPAQHQKSGIESRSVFTPHMSPCSRIQHLTCFAHELTLISLFSHFITKKLVGFKTRLAPEPRLRIWTSLSMPSAIRKFYYLSFPRPLQIQTTPTINPSTPPLIPVVSTTHPTPATHPDIF